MPFLSLADARSALGDDVELDEDFFFIARNGPDSMRQAVLEVVCERIPADVHVYSARCGIRRAGRPPYPMHANRLPRASAKS